MKFGCASADLDDKLLSFDICVGQFHLSLRHLVVPVVELLLECLNLLAHLHLVLLDTLEFVSLIYISLVESLLFFSYHVLYLGCLVGQLVKFNLYFI